MAPNRIFGAAMMRSPMQSIQLLLVGQEHDIPMNHLAAQLKLMKLNV